jgi:hypothetical protein
MAFCEYCGTQLSDTAKFCRSCGKAAGAEVASSPLAASKQSRPIGKWILGILVFLVLLGVVGGGVMFYLFHRLSQKAEQITQSLPEAGAVVNTPAPPPATPASLDVNKLVTPEQGQCALFSKEELTRVLGTNFTHSDADATGCTYKGDAPREFVRTEALWTGGRKLVKLKSDAYAGLRQSMANQHYTKAEIDAHVFPIAPYPGVGDEAWVDLVNIVTARKGDVGITMDLRYYHASDDLTKMLVNAALARLGGDNPAPPVTPNPPVNKNPSF